MNSLKQLYTMTMVIVNYFSPHTRHSAFVASPLMWLVFIQDVHARYRTEAHQDVVGRFNERWLFGLLLSLSKCRFFFGAIRALDMFFTLLRFILSLASCKNCVVIDDQLNILPVSSHMAGIKPVPPKTQVTRILQEHLAFCYEKNTAFSGYILPQVSPLVSSCLGGWVVSTRPGAQGPEGVPPGHPARGCTSGLLQDHGPSQDNLLSSFLLH